MQKTLIEEDWWAFGEVLGWTSQLPQAFFLLSPAGFWSWVYHSVYFSEFAWEIFWSFFFHNEFNTLKILLLLLLNLAVKGPKSVNYSADIGFQILFYACIMLRFFFSLADYRYIWSRNSQGFIKSFQFLLRAWLWICAIPSTMPRLTQTWSKTSKYMLGFSGSFVHISEHCKSPSELAQYWEDADLGQIILSTRWHTHAYGEIISFLLRKVTTASHAGEAGDFRIGCSVLFNSLMLLLLRGFFLDA